MQEQGSVAIADGDRGNSLIEHIFKASYAWSMYRDQEVTA
jgi:hypothetical protein